MRALRLLKRRVRSWREEEAVLDEEATAERAALDGLWWPVTRPPTRRWLDLTLVIDTSPSLILWHPRISRFIALLEQTGAFRTIHIKQLDTSRTVNGEPAAPALHGGTPGAPHRDPAELLDPTGKRVILVLTDMVSEAWRHDLVGPVLAQWARSMPVTVIHALPQRLWYRGGSALRRALLTVPMTLSPNRRWTVDLPDSWLDDEPSATGAVPVPVLELDARYLAWWARLITAGHRDPANAMVLLARDEPSPREFDRDPVHTLSADERVQAFLSTASPPAFRLATLLAAVAVPITLPVVRTVQSELVPESGPDHLAEVLTSPLLQEYGHDAAILSFPASVRQTLLSSARRTDTAKVTQLLADRYGDRVLEHLGRAMLHPEEAMAHALTTHEATLVAAEASVLFQALSGPYLAGAGRAPTSTSESEAAQSAGSPGLPQADADNPENTAVSDPMSKTAPSSTPTHTGDSETPGRPAPSGEPVVGLPGSPGSPTSTEPAAHHGSVVTLHSRERTAEDPPPVWGNVPPRNPNFTGREELLAHLNARLAPGSTTAVLPAALHGLGGIGKTHMAVEYIYRHLQDYDIIWWIQATQQAQIRAGLAELAKHLQLPGSAEANTAVPAVLEALRLGRPFRRWLLVFDAAESPEMVRPFFPTNGPGEILVTSRDSDWSGVARPLEINVFRREESIELLQRRVPEITTEDANRLADTLGDLPLAIEQSAAWLAVTGMPVSEYLRLFNEKVSEILGTSTTADYDASVAAAWNVSFDDLQSRNPSAHQLLQICAFYAPEPISRNLFSGVRGVSISPELDAALRDPIKLSHAIRDINRYSLAKIDHRNNTILLHRLVQLVLRDRMPPPIRQQMRHGAHLLLANVDPNDPESGKYWPQYQELLPHAYTAETADCRDGWVRQLTVNLMRFLFSWGDHDEAVRLARATLQHWTDKHGEKDPQTLEVAWRLAMYLWAVGRYSEAAELNRKTLALRLEVSGENSEETLGIQANILADLNAQGDFFGNLRLSEEIYRKSRKLFGDDDPEALRAGYLHGIGLRLTGNYQAARELDENIYSRRVELLGPDHRETVFSLVAVITDRREQGDYAWARAEMEKVIDFARNQYGDDSIVTWTWSHYLAIGRRKDGDHEAASALSKLVYDYILRRYGHDHPSTMMRALARSIDLRHQRDLQQARELGEDTFNRYRTNLGENHPHTLSAAVDLAVTLRLLRDPSGARQLDERCLEQLRHQLGPDHPHAIVAAVNLASDLAALNDSDGALALNIEAVDRARRSLGPDHPLSLAASLNHALDLHTLGRSAEAESQHMETLDGYRRTLGESHPATVAAADRVRANCDIDPLPL